ncbi:sphingosine 1-phosphate receptor 1 [Microcaecilia unicolor]|uniref:Sphingosine 1-phosphate receptor 1 n=1 Tax=Microcaecilia unicolor TaxID=1415580 RepID=A0A6P7YE76_9AMPH|nr:sphingosine 1-phosphate receptor 1 [Microcaecilia unicolor]XP_030063349.1 sphingosine 1-phosphate receptor 1 [Microcaecilia unicolor]
MAFSDYANRTIIVLHYNYTGKLNLNSSVDTGMKWTSVLLIIICCFIIVENILVLLTIWRTKKFHRPMYYFIGNLAFSDMLAGAVYIANILLSGEKTYTLTPAQWMMREGSMFVALSASVFSLLSIAIERFSTMLKMKVQNESNCCRSSLLIGGCWVVSLILGGLPIMGWNCIGVLEQCSTVLPLYLKHYLLFCTTVFSLLLLSVVILYARIYTFVRTKSRKMTFRQHATKSTGNSEKSMALLKTVIIVLSAFIICWSPLFILLLLDVSCRVKTCPILFKAEYFLALAVLNSATNPIIYTLTNKEMRRAFRKMVSSCNCASIDSGATIKRPFVGKEFSRSRSDNSSHRQRDEVEYPETIMSSGNPTSSS